MDFRVPFVSRTCCVASCAARGDEVSSPGRGTKVSGEQRCQETKNGFLASTCPKCVPGTFSPPHSDHHGPRRGVHGAYVREGRAQLRSKVNSVFSGVTSASSFEVSGCRYFLGMISLAPVPVPLMETWFSPMAAPSPSLNVVSTKVPSCWIGPEATRPMSTGLNLITPLGKGCPLKVTFPLTGTSRALSPWLGPQPAVAASKKTANFTEHDALRRMENSYLLP